MCLMESLIRERIKRWGEGLVHRPGRMKLHRESSGRVDKPRVAPGR